MNKKNKNIKRKKWSKDDTQLALLALPTTIWFFCFAFLPMFGVLMAFKNYRIVEAGKSFFYNLLHSETTWFENFEFLFSSGSGAQVLKLTLTYNVVFILLGILVPITLSLMMSQLHGKRYAKTCQTLMFLPYFMSWVVVGYFVYAYLSPDKGLLNTMLTMLGKETISWYQEPEYWPYFLVFLNVWKGMGYGMVVYLAAITGIDGSLYEAAMMDGATKFQQAMKITLPMMKSIIIMMFILSMGSLVRSDFGLFYQVPKGSNSLYMVTETIDVFIYKMIKEQPNPNMGSAASFLQSVISCFLILLTNKIVKHVDNDSAII